MSHDGLATTSLTSDAPSTWGSIAAFSDTDASTVYIFGDNGGSAVSKNAGTTFTAISPAPNFGGSPWTGVAAAINPLDSTKAWQACATPSAATTTVFNAYDATNNNVSDLTAPLATALGETTAGFELYTTGTSTFRLRAVGASGSVAVSDDAASTWTAVQTSSALSKCAAWATGARQITSLASNHERVATW